MNVKTIISNEATKRRERMYDAIQKGNFEITYKQSYSGGQGKTVTIWKVWSNHTHCRSPRLYTVSQVKEQGRSHWACTCPDFEANGQWFPCKHILYIQEV